MSIHRRSRGTHKVSCTVSLVTLALGLASMVPAAAGAADFYIPAAAHAAGAGSTFWQTDVMLQASSSGGTCFTIELLKTGQENVEPQRYEPAECLAQGTAVLIEDILLEGFGFTGSGALRVIAEDDAMITSRTYNISDRGTFGQFVQAIAGDQEFGPSHTVFLNGLRGSLDRATGFRSNLGLLNVSDESLELVVRLFDHSGVEWRSFAADLEPYEHRQFNRVHRDGDFPPGITTVFGFATVEVVSGAGGFLAYASVVDNRTGDGIYIPGRLEGVATTPSPSPTPTPSPTPPPSPSEAVISMVDGTTFRLDIHDIYFCLSNQCTRTLRVDNEAGERFEFELSEVDYVDGPSDKVVWAVGTCLDPTMRRDRFYVKTHGCETSDHYVWYNCNINLNREDLAILGVDTGTGEDLNLKFKDIERIDFP
jgi:hypothetical protein